MRVADADWHAAKLLIAQEELHLQAAFFSQQAIEKALKAMCILKQQRFEKTHDLAEILETVGTFAPSFAQEWAGVKAVTQYAVKGRYPVDVIEYAVAPEDAIDLAEILLKAVHEWMGQQAHGETEGEATEAQERS